MRYFLLGLPGSGKSHWGKKWSEKINLPFFDLDEIIENNEGETITEIFKNEGEKYFRNLETFYLDKLISNYQAMILSTGGGTPCFNENIDFMNKEGITVFLNPPVEESAKRIWKPKTDNQRPMFADCKSLEDVQKTLSELYENRKIFYKKATKELNSWDIDSLKRF